MLNGPFFPFGGEIGDDFFRGSSYRRPTGYGNWRYQDPLQLRREQEERRRRVEMEHYRRQQQVRRQREGELLRKKMAQEEAMRKRLAEEEYLRRKEAEQAERRRCQKLANQAYSVVRGPDGRLYRFPLRHEDDEDHSIMNAMTSGKRNFGNIKPLGRDVQPKHQYIRKPDGNIYKVSAADAEMMDIEYDDDSECATESLRSSRNKENQAPKGYDVTEPGSRKKHGTTQVSVTIHDDAKNNVDGMETDPISDTTKQSRRRVTVIVEDVPDSEVEDDEMDRMKSLWRNRRPGPGESWMEPIF